MGTNGKLVLSIFVFYAVIPFAYSNNLKDVKKLHDWWNTLDYDIKSNSLYEAARKLKYDRDEFDFSIEDYMNIVYQSDINATNLVGWEAVLLVRILKFSFVDDLDSFKLNGFNEIDLFYYKYLLFWYNYCQKMKEFRKKMLSIEKVMATAHLRLHQFCSLFFNEIGKENKSYPYVYHNFLWVLDDILIRSLTQKEQLDKGLVMNFPDKQRGKVFLFNKKGIFIKIKNKKNLYIPVSNILTVKLFGDSKKETYEEFQRHKELIFTVKYQETNSTKLSNTVVLTLNNEDEVSLQSRNFFSILRLILAIENGQRVSNY